MMRLLLLVGSLRRDAPAPLRLAPTKGSTVAQRTAANGREALKDIA